MKVTVFPFRGSGRSKLFHNNAKTLFAFFALILSEHIGVFQRLNVFNDAVVLMAHV